MSELYWVAMGLMGGLFFFLGGQMGRKEDEERVLVRGEEPERVLIEERAKRGELEANPLFT